MANFARCPKCGEYDFISRHACKPAFRTWIHDYHEVGDKDDGRVVHADDHEDAAREALSRHDWDQAEGPTTDGVDVTVEAPSGLRKTFVVWGEPTVDYRAKSKTGV